MSFLVQPSHFSRLSLGSMVPTTRSRRQQLNPSGESEVSRSIIMVSEPSSDAEDSDASMEGEEDDDEDTRTVILSPYSKINYDISNLDQDTQSEVRQLFRETPASEPPPLVLQWCQFNQDQEENQFYAFQLHEVVPRSIRIGSPTSKYHQARCNCMGESPKPCKHLIYLLDQLNRITGDKVLDEPVQTLRPDGSPTQMDQPFDKIATFHLGLLASNLHCDVGSPESQAAINPVRLEETRELLAAVGNSDADDYAVKNFRPDIFEQDRDHLLQQHDILTDDDLTKTVARMLMTNNDFFAYFLKLLGPTSRARDCFRNIQRHIDRVLRELDAYYRQHHTTSEQQQETMAAAHSAAEGPRDVAWAARHILRAVSTIQYLLQNRQDPPSPAERASAARTLVRILHTVVFEWNRDMTSSITTTTTTTATTTNTTSNTSLVPGSIHTNLYLRLMDTQTTPTSKSFILDSLANLPEQNQWIETLEEIEAKLTTFAPPPTYMMRLRNLITLMRSSRPPNIQSEVVQVVASAAATPAAAAAAGGSSNSSSSNKRSGGEGSGRPGGPKRAR